MPRTPIVILGALLVLSACARMQVQEVGESGGAPELTANRVITADGARLPLTYWYPEGEPARVVLALHGFNDFSGAFESLADALTADATAVYAYDQRGFGATRQRGIWAGRERLVDDALTVLELLDRRYPDTPLYLVGESMGAAVAMHVLDDAPGSRLAGGILLAPAVWARDRQPWYQRAALWLGIRTVPGIRLDREWIDIRPTDDPEVMAYWDTHPLVIRRTRLDALEGVTRLMDSAMATVPDLPSPLLTLYGGEDEVVPPAAICGMLEAWPADGRGARRFAYYPGGWHLLTRDSRASETIDDMGAWLHDPHGALPSGHELEVDEAATLLCNDRRR